MNQELQTQKQQRLPEWGNALGMSLFTVSLASLFVAGWVAWVIIRLQWQEHGYELHQMRVPKVLWLSTALMFLSGILLHVSYKAHKKLFEQAGAVFLVLSGVVAFLFIASQGAGMTQLLQSHVQEMQGYDSVGVYPFTAVLVLIHAVHVMGGVIPLMLLFMPRMTGKPLKKPSMFLVVYWHFLEIVWLCLMLTFVLMG